MCYKMQSSIHILEQYLQQITYIGLQISRIPMQEHRPRSQLHALRAYMQLTLLTWK